MEGHIWITLHLSPSDKNQVNKRVYQQCSSGNIQSDFRLNQIASIHQPTEKPVTSALRSTRSQVSAVGGKSKEILAELLCVEGAAILTCKQDWSLSLSKLAFLSAWGDEAVWTPMPRGQGTGYALILKTVKADIIFWPSFLLLWFTLYICRFEQTRDIQPWVASSVAYQRARDHCA